MVVTNNNLIMGAASPCDVKLVFKFKIPPVRSACVQVAVPGTLRNYREVQLILKLPLMDIHQSRQGYFIMECCGLWCSLIFYGSNKY